MQIYEIKNMKMLKEIEDKFNPDIITALRKTDRELFIHDAIKHSAFRLDALPMSSSQWVSSPLTVAKMTSYIMAYDKDVIEPDSILEIGLGSGYQAVVLSHLIRRVFSIERIESLWLEARERIKKLNISNISIKLDDGMKGWKTYAPYDRILLSACARQIPKELLNQLSNGGVLVAPILENDKQMIARYIKQPNGAISGEILESCEFVPIKEGIQKR